jgi:hypothetical protein
MKSVKGSRFILAVVFSTALLVGPVAEAGHFLALNGDSAPVERQIGLFEQALNWLTGVWTDMTSIFAASETTSPSGTSSCNPDSGIGLDPEGCPRP